MPTGKPDFNLNSYGVKYLSKEEVQEFLNKYEIPTGKDQAALASERDRKGTGFKSSESAKKLISEVKPAEATPKPKVTRNSKFVFNDPKYGIPDTRKPQTEGHGESGVVPPNTSAQDTRISTGTAIGNKGGREGGVGNAPEELTGSDVTSSKQGNRNVAVGVGEKGKEVFDEKEGVGEKYEKRYNPDGSPITQKQRKEKLQKEAEAKEKREKETKLNQALQKLEREKQQKKKIPQKTGKGDKSQDIDDYNPEGDTESDVETEGENKKHPVPKWEKKKPKIGIYDPEKDPEGKKEDKRVRAHFGKSMSSEMSKKSNDIITEMNIIKLNLMKKDDPCWEGYEAIGMKEKDGKQVPNCVPKGDKKKAEEEKKPLNKPMRDDGNKKFKVYVRDPSSGNIITVRFGDPNMEIKRDSPERRASFRARHKCSEQKDITSAAYWSCKMWEKTSSVSDNIGKSADETIFKAISLKLDLTKTLK